MTERQSLFDGYLTKHLSHVADPFRFRKRTKAHLAYNYMSLLPKNKDARILEIGPGFGEWLELLVAEQKYTHVQAIDVSQEVADFCNNIILGLTSVVEDTQTFLKQHAQSFDVILMFHVLEHIPKQQIPGLLAALYEALKPNGKLLIEVPNMANPFTGLNFRFADFTHEVGFTELSLQYVLQSAHFREISIFGPRILKDHYKRIPQTIIRMIVDGMITIIFRAYATRRPRVISPILSALAIKSEHISQLRG